MRLAELEPELKTHLSGGSLGQAASLTEAQGIWFLCPACFIKNRGAVRTHSILVWFEGRGVPADAEPLHRWKVSGASIEDISLWPSIDCTKNKQGHIEWPEEWHGHITNGAIA